MTIKHLLYSLLSIIAVVVLFLIWKPKQIIHPYGQVVKSIPQISKIEKDYSWEKNGYTINAIAKIELKALVLSKEHYSFDRESDLVPYDLALGWGPMSDQKNLEKISISQGRRWFFWNSEEMPISVVETERNASNMHLIPPTSEIESILDDIIKGNVIQLKGYLVNVEATDKWEWKSSTRLDDTGGGACELIWVESLNILE